MKKKSLVVVGSGIKFVSHLTIEAKAYIENSEKILFLVNDPAMECWLKKTNTNAESLSPIYFRFHDRNTAYNAITSKILEELENYNTLCVVIYGHPTVYAKPALDAVRYAKKNGVAAKILPGISAEDCLFADLLIDPGSCGCLSFDATDLIVYKRKLQPYSHLIIWQVSVIGIVTHEKNPDITNGLKVLKKYLLTYYSPKHPIVYYTAAQYQGFEAKIKESSIDYIPSIIPDRTTTLYIPPKTNSFIRMEQLQTIFK